MKKAGIVHGGCITRRQLQYAYERRREDTDAWVICENTQGNPVAIAELESVTGPAGAATIQCQTFISSASHNRQLKNLRRSKENGKGKAE